MLTRVIPVLVFAALTSAAHAEPPKTDLWAGTWTAMPGRQRTPENTLLLKDGDSYRLERVPYQTYRFKETSPGVLECSNVGKIRRGKLTLPGLPDTVVLHAEMCYEQFYLVYQGPPAR